MQYLSATLVFLGLAGTIVSAGPDAAADVQGLSVPDATETRELGKKHGGHGGGYAAPRPIIIAAPQKKMPIVQPVGKKGGYGGYGMGGGYGGYGGYGRYLQEEEIISEASIEDSADERELGKKKHGGHGGGYGYGYQQPIIIAAPQKKMPIVQPVGKKGGFGGYGLGGGYGGYGGYGRYLQEEEIISEASIEDGADERELGKKKHGGHGGGYGYGYQQPIIIAAPQKKMPIVQPVGKKGGFGGYGMGGGYGGYGRYMQEDEIISEASIEDGADERELGKKKHGGHGGGYGYQQPIIIAAPQKKMPIVQPVGKKGGFGGYGMGGGYGGYGGYGRYLQEEEIISEASIEDGADERELGKKKHGGHGGGYGYQQPIIIAAPQKKMPIIQPVGKKGGFGGYGLGGGYGGYGRYMQEDEIISEASIEDGADERELGKKKHGGHGGGYGYQQPIIIAAPQKKMPIVQPVGKKGGFGGYGMGGGYGGYGRYMQEDEIISEASTEDSADERELGKKHGGHGGGYGYRPTVIIAAPQKKMPIVQPVGKKGGFGGYGMGGGYGGYGRYLQEEDVVEAAADERSLKQQVHHKAPPQKIVRPITKKAPAPIKMAPMKAAPRPITKKAPRPITKKAPRPVTKTVRTITKKAPRPAPMKKQPVQQFTKQARPVYHQNHYGHHGF